MKKRLLTTLTLVTLLLSLPSTVYAITEAEVEAVGKEAAAGNVFIWVLCAVGFLKISQKIDSFMSSLGINVGNTGGSMMAEMIIAARGLSMAKGIPGGGFFTGGTSRGVNAQGASFMTGGLVGAVGRQFTQKAMGAMTGHSNNPISRKAFEASLKKGGSFANNVTSAVAQGNINYTGSMTGAGAASALSSYMGQIDMEDAPSYSDVEIGGGRIMGTETSVDHPNGTAFGMYNANQYMAPEGDYETVTTADNSVWYKQYATDAVERTPYMTAEGQIEYRENIVQRLPNSPRRKDRITHLLQARPVLLL